MIIQKQAPHKHSFGKIFTKIVPVRNADGRTVAHDTIKMKECAGKNCKEVISYDMERQVK